jgi:hypothetical protein
MSIKMAAAAYTCLISMLGIPFFAIMAILENGKNPLLTRNSTQAQIEAAGGVIVNAGQVLATKVVAGTIPVAASNSDGPAGSMSVTIGKGQTKKYAFTNANTFVAY